jgi:hypothetical protein
VLLLRPNGLKPRESPLVMLRAMKRLTGAFVASVRRGGPEFPSPDVGPFRLLGPISRRIRRLRGIGETGTA